jgi:hypothetical protein
MAWIYLAESAASRWHWSPGQSLLPTVSRTPSHKRFCSTVCEKDGCPRHRSGMMCEHSTDAIFHLSISSTAASPARISALRDLDEAWRASAVDCSSRLSALHKKLLRRLSSSRTSQALGLEDFDKLSEHLPLWGTTVGGHVYLPQALEPDTCADAGSYLPTPTASTYGTSQNGCPGDGRQSFKGKGKPSLETMARRNLWPTPRASDIKGEGRGAAERRMANGAGCTLAGAVKIWPTPCARDWKSGRGHASRRSEHELSAVVERSSPTGRLNPTWVEWLMGYRTGWTELSAWATQWFPCK